MPHRKLQNGILARRYPRANLQWSYIVRMEKAIRLLCEVMTNNLKGEEEEKTQHLAKINRALNLTHSMHRPTTPTSPS